MEETVKERKYELAYYLGQNFDESELKSHIENIESIVSSSGGTMTTSKEPKKIRLSYPIKHQRFAFMRVSDFNAPAEAIEKINAQMKLQDGVLRFLIIQKQEGKELRLAADQKTRRLHTHQQPVPQPKKEITQVEEKEMEKKIEDVLEKI